MGAAARLRLALLLAAAAAWRVCDVADHGAVGDGQTDDSRALRSALAACDEVVIPRHRSCVSGPLNLTSNQVLRVDGALLASTIPAHFPLMEPVVGYGWSRDTNCFPANSTRRGFREGALRHAPVVGAYNASNVSVVGGGVIDGRAGEPLGWWDNCTRCRGAKPPDPAFPPDEAFCLAASRPKLLEFQYVTGLTVAGNAVGDPLHLKDSPFWTLTPSYSRNVRVRDLRITAPVRTPGIGNTDGVNLDSCRDALAAPGVSFRNRTLPKLFARRAAPPGRRACTEERDRPSTVAPRMRVPLAGARVATAADTGGERLRQQQRRRRLHEERPRRLRHHGLHGVVDEEVRVEHARGQRAQIGVRLDRRLRAQRVRVRHAHERLVGHGELAVRGHRRHAAAVGLLHDDVDAQARGLLGPVPGLAAGHRAEHDVVGVQVVNQGLDLC